MKYLKLTKGLFATVDDDDFEVFSKLSWYSQGRGRCIYASRKTDLGMFYLHREIMGLKKGDKREVDHKNENTLDNRRSNLRVCSHAENNYHKGKQSNNKSGFKGVYFKKKEGKWKAEIKAGKSVNLGYFSTPQEAHNAYCEAASELHGEFAHV